MTTPGITRQPEPLILTLLNHEAARALARQPTQPEASPGQALVAEHEKRLHELAEELSTDRAELVVLERQLKQDQQEKHELTASLESARAECATAEGALAEALKAQKVLERELAHATTQLEQLGLLTQQIEEEHGIEAELMRQVTALNADKKALGQQLEEELSAHSVALQGLGQALEEAKGKNQSLEACA